MSWCKKNFPLSKHDLAELIKTPPLPEDFFLNPTPTVARNLLGKGLISKGKKCNFLAQIVEVEAYLFNDESSHSFCGPTRRNLPMFGKPRTCYVYLSYGVHYCLNVVTACEGVGEAVLIRAAMPILGIGEMLINRGFDHYPKKGLQKTLLNGPGKLTQAMNITLRQNGLTFNHSDLKLISLERNIAQDEIESSPRIGISKAKEKHLRFYIKHSQWIS